MKNLIFLIIDCLRADVCYGKKGRAKTPYIRSLIRKGAVFEKMMSVTTTTTPSIASILTGLYPFAHGIRSLQGYSLSKNATTIAELLRSAGYDTAAFVSGPLIRETGLDKGFNTYETRDAETFIYNDWGDNLYGKLSKLKEPFFVLLHLFELHSPPVPRYIDKGFDSLAYGFTTYERAFSSLDRSLKRVLSALPIDKTIIMLTGDHGENYYKPAWVKLKEKIFSKKDLKYPEDLFHGYNLFDFLINVPFIIVGPGIPRRTIPDLSSHVDVLPTICELTGAALPSGINGRSLLPAIKGGALPAREVYTEACGIVIPSENDWLKGIRTDRWKFIYAPKNSNIRPMLFDLKSDPGESKNLYDKMPDIADRLKDKISRMESENLCFVGESLSSEETEAIENKLKMLGYL